MKRSAVLNFFRHTGLAAGLFLLSVSAALSDSHVYKLFVDGLACPFCAYGVEKKIGDLTGVVKVEIDIVGGVVNVTLNDGASLSEEAAKGAVAEAGFTLRKFQVPGKGS